MSVQSSSPARATQQELVRLLYLQHGNHKVVSELSGVDYDLVRQWAVRGKWTKQDVSQSVTSPIRAVADNVESELADNERETRLGLSKHAKHAIRAINKSVHPAKWTKEAKEIAQTAGIVHGWADAKPSNQFTLNVLNVNTFDVSVEE